MYGQVPCGRSESTYVDIDGEGTKAGENYYPKRGLSRAEVSYTYTGEIEGTSTLGGHSDDGYQLVLSYDIG